MLNNNNLFWKFQLLPIFVKLSSRSIKNRTNWFRMQNCIIKAYWVPIIVEEYLHSSNFWKKIQVSFFMRESTGWWSSTQKAWTKGNRKSGTASSSMTHNNSTTLLLIQMKNCTCNESSLTLIVIFRHSYRQTSIPLLFWVFFLNNSINGDVSKPVIEQ